MSPPRAGSGPLGRLADALRRRLRPERGAPPATVPGLGSGEETAVAAAERPVAAEPERAVTADEAMAVTDAAVDADADAPPRESDARFDAARDRLRSTIQAPPEHDAD